jgi:4-amino-4-deoxychorismate lyase
MILVNGAEDAWIDAANRGLAYGDGVFRTLAVVGGLPRHWSRHYAKLAHDCAAINLRCPDEELLKQEARRIALADADCALKLIITRGEGERGYRYAEHGTASRIVLGAALPNYPQTYSSHGVKVRLCRLRLGHQPALAGVKHLNRLENVLARAEWSAADIAEGLLCDVDDYVIGGTMTNVFVVKNSNLATPRLHGCGVAGVTRDRVIAAAVRHGVGCNVVDVPWSDVLAADEIFVVNTLAGVWPVRDIDGESFAPGPITTAVQHWLKQEDDAQMA